MEQEKEYDVVDGDTIRFNDFRFNSKNIVSMMKIHNIPFCEEGLYQTDCEENLKEFFSQMLEMLDVEFL